MTALQFLSDLLCSRGGEVMINGKLTLNLPLSFSPQSLFAPVITPLSFSQHTSSPFLPFCSYVCILVLGIQRALVGKTGMSLQARLSSCKEEQTDPLYHLPPTNSAVETIIKHFILPSDNQDLIIKLRWLLDCSWQSSNYFDNIYFNLIKIVLECCHNCVRRDRKIAVVKKFQRKTTKT